MEGLRRNNYYLNIKCKEVTHGNFKYEDNALKRVQFSLSGFLRCKPIAMTTYIQVINVHNTLTCSSFSASLGEYLQLSTKDTEQMPCSNMTRIPYLFFTNLVKYFNNEPVTIPTKYYITCVIFRVLHKDQQCQL
jgi:hypothetical protein